MKFLINFKNRFSDKEKGFIIVFAYLTMQLIEIFKLHLINEKAFSILYKIIYLKLLNFSINNKLGEKMPTHGSMTKAGKVRKATPKIEPKGRKNLSPRIKNRKEYIKRVEKAEKARS